MRRMWNTQMATLRGENESWNAVQADRIDRQAAKQAKRSAKMSRKVGRGNIRAARAATTAEGPPPGRRPEAGRLSLWARRKSAAGTSESECVNPAPVWA